MLSLRKAATHAVRSPFACLRGLLPSHRRRPCGCPVSARQHRHLQSPRLRWRVKPPEAAASPDDGSPETKKQRVCVVSLKFFPCGGSPVVPPGAARTAVPRPAVLLCCPPHEVKRCFAALGASVSVYSSFRGIKASTSSVRHATSPLPSLLGRGRRPVTRTATRAAWEILSRLSACGGRLAVESTPVRREVAQSALLWDACTSEHPGNEFKQVVRLGGSLCYAPLGHL